MEIQASPLVVVNGSDVRCVDGVLQKDPLWAGKLRNVFVAITQPTTHPFLQRAVPVDLQYFHVFIPLVAGGEFARVSVLQDTPSSVVSVRGTIAYPLADGSEYEELRGFDENVLTEEALRQEIEYFSMNGVDVFQSGVGVFFKSRGVTADPYLGPSGSFPFCGWDPDYTPVPGTLVVDFDRFGVAFPLAPVAGVVDAAYE